MLLESLYPGCLIFIPGGGDVCLLGGSKAGKVDMANTSFTSPRDHRGKCLS